MTLRTIGTYSGFIALGLTGIPSVVGVGLTLFGILRAVIVKIKQFIAFRGLPQEYKSDPTYTKPYKASVQDALYLVKSGLICTVPIFNGIWMAHKKLKPKVRAEYFTIL